VHLENGPLVVEVHGGDSWSEHSADRLQAVCPIDSPPAPCFLPTFPFPHPILHSNRTPFIFSPISFLSHFHFTFAYDIFFLLSCHFLLMVWLGFEALFSRIGRVSWPPPRVWWTNLAYLYLLALHRFDWSEGLIKYLRFLRITAGLWGVPIWFLEDNIIVWTFLKLIHGI